VLALLAAAALPGCRTAYLAQLAYEQGRYLSRARPIQQLIDEATDPKVRHTLELVLEVRRFAADHGLDPGKSYLEVADTSATVPFQVVTAARFDSLEPYTWWYPVVGAMPYRGYFDRGQAKSYADGLKEQGLDTFIVEASAYSTLGWFADPLPSKVIEHGPVAATTTVLHELLHQNLFVAGQMAFNETLATAVSYRLAADFFDGRGDTASADRVRNARLDWLASSRVLDDGAGALQTLFAKARKERWPHDRLVAERESVYRGIQESATSRGTVRAAALDEDGWNNASFLASYRYAEHASLLDDFLARQRDLPQALDRLRALTKDGADGYAAISAHPEATAALDLGFASR